MRHWQGAVGSCDTGGIAVVESPACHWTLNSRAGCHRGKAG